MSITRTTVEAYRVQKDHEWATIVVQGWQRNGSGRASDTLMEQGEILVHSSFGSWGHQWCNLGRSIKPFLAGVSFDYLMGKLLPGELREFDFAASLDSWKKHLKAARRCRDLDAEQFREIWDASCDSNECGIEMFMHRLEESRPFELRDHPLWDSINGYAVCRDNSMATAFWRELWPLFVAAVRAEAVPANEALVAA